MKKGDIIYVQVARSTVDMEWFKPGGCSSYIDPYKWYEARAHSLFTKCFYFDIPTLGLYSCNRNTVHLGGGNWKYRVNKPKEM